MDAYDQAPLVVQSRRATETLAIVGILLLAALLRWIDPTVVEFKYDEAHIFQLSRNVAAGVSFPLLTGGTSVGIERPPLDVYLLALPAVVTGGRPEAAVWLLGALGLVAVALTYHLGRSISGPMVGLLAALFMAANPWLVHYDRKLWAHIQVVLSVAVLVLAWKVVVRQRAGAAFWFVVLAIMQLLTHVLALVQALSWVGAVLVAPHRWRSKAMVYGLTTGLVLMAPYLWALFDSQSLEKPNGPLEGVRVQLGAGWGQLAGFIGGSGIASLAGAIPAASPWWQAASVISWLSWMLVLVGLIQVVAWARRGPQASGARLLLVWGVGPFMALSLAAPVYTQYWTVLTPLPALLFAIGAHAFVHRVHALIAWHCTGRATPRLARLWSGALALVAIMALVWVGSYCYLLSTVRNGGGASTFGVPLLRWQEATTAAQAWARRSGTDHVLVAVKGVDPRFEDEPAAVTALFQAPVVARFVAPSSPYALVDVRYELEPAVLALTMGNGTWPYDTLPSSPGAMVLDEAKSNLLLWTIERPDWQGVLVSIGEVLWQGRLADGRAPATLYRLPTRAYLWQRLAAAVENMAGGLSAGQTAVVTNLPDSPLATSALVAKPVLVMPAAANDRASADTQAGALQDATIQRVVFVDQPSGWWDNEQITRSALSSRYAPVVDTQVAIWPVTVFERPPSDMPLADYTFVGISDTGASSRLRLVQAAITAADNGPGGVVGVHLAWDVPTPHTENLKITVQLLDESGQLAAQADQDFPALKAAGGVTSHGLVLPEGIPSGRYRLILALYDSQTGQRHSVEPGSTDFAVLGDVLVR